MLSKNRLPFVTIEESSRDLCASMRTRLHAICAQPDQHARFLNTLSLLEHIGSRKIMVSQIKSAWDNGTLKHLAEETRHAYFFKRAAEKCAGRNFDYNAADTMAGASAKSYMGRLDAQIARALKAPDASLPYLYMSLIVEFRAIWFYRLYQEVLSERAMALSLKSVLAEEELHLDSMLASVRQLDTDADNHIAAFLKFEDGRFRQLWSEIERAHEAHEALTEAAQ